MGQTMKILCVEDDIDIATLLDNVLSSDGHYVTICDNGKDALSLVEKENFNLILLDLQLPQLSGKEVINSLAQNGLLADNNIVILSAIDIAESEILEFKQKGIKGFLQKPMSLEGIFDVVKKFE